MKISLPIDSKLPNIYQSLLEEGRLVLVAEPGAGKSSRVPSYLVGRYQNANRKKVIVLQPRRIAAKSLSLRVAQEESWTLGKEIGYIVKNENRISSETQLIYMTEGILLNKLNDSNFLSSVKCIVLDEFHERSIALDLCISLIKDYQSIDPDLHLLVMSASMDAEKVSKYLEGCSILQVAGTNHPLSIAYTKKSLRFQFSELHLEEILSAIRAYRETETNRHILVFLPGKYEIKMCLEYMEKPLEDLSLFALHGSLGLEEQQLAISPSNRQKVLFATNIAETSITIDNLGFVIDVGLIRQASFNEKNFTQNLELKRISKASATQRAGRAARQAPGQCLRLWSRLEEQGMQEYEVPEIHRGNLLDSMAYLHSWGIKNLKEFDWYEKPKLEKLSSSLDILKLLKLTSKNCDLGNFELSKLGKTCSQFPCDLGQALFLVLAREIGFQNRACLLVAILQEGPISLPWKNYSKAQESDLLIAMDLVESNFFSKTKTRNILDTKKSLEKILKAIDPLNLKVDIPELMDIKKYADHDKFSALLLISHSHLLCRKRYNSKSRSKSYFGNGVDLGSTSSLISSEYFLAFHTINKQSMGGGTESSTSFSHGIPQELVLSLLKDRLFSVEQIEEQDSFQLKKYSQEFFGKLEIGAKRLEKMNPEDLQKNLQTKILNQWEEFVTKALPLESFYSRLNFCQELGMEFNKTYDSDEFKNTLLEMLCIGKSKLEEVLAQDIQSILNLLVDVSDLQSLNKNAPEYLVGIHRKYLIEYNGEHAPSVRIKIQDAFFWKESPKICGGIKKLCFILLAPNQRPAQITDDLARFWSGSYKEVRKALKARYPKHNWPEKP